MAPPPTIEIIAPRTQGSLAPHAQAPRARGAVPRPALFPPGLIVVGASTGGPQSLIALFSTLAPALPHVPVCVTLHMPRDLMPVIATHIARQCRIATRVVVEPIPLERGIVNFAPGDRHLDFHRDAGGVTIGLRHSRPDEYCKPAIDVMFAAAARSHGVRTVGVVLSGMGKDGLAGARAIVGAGGLVLVQDKATAAVWGMPGAIAKADLATAVMNPSALGREILRRVEAGQGLA